MEVVYAIIKIITFPGTILKGFFEQLACRIYKIPVTNNDYIQTNELCGHVEHDLVRGKKSFAVCFLPFILNLLAGLAITTPATVLIFYIDKSSVVFSIIAYFAAYLGISLLVNMFPLIEDSLSMWESLYGKESTATMVSKILLAPFAVILLCGSYLERYCITLITSLILAYYLPEIFIAIL